MTSRHRITHPSRVVFLSELLAFYSDVQHLIIAFKLFIYSLYFAFIIDVLYLFTLLSTNASFFSNLSLFTFFVLVLQERVKMRVFVYMFV